MMNSKWKHWICLVCRQEVFAKDKPQPIRWADGHVCSFVEDKETTK